MIRNALNGLLRKGELGRVQRRAAGDHGSSSGSETTEHSTSLASTLRDTEDIREVGWFILIYLKAEIKRSRII